MQDEKEKVTKKDQEIAKKNSQIEALNNVVKARTDETVKLSSELEEVQRTTSDLLEELAKKERAEKLRTAQMNHDFHAQRKSLEAKLAIIADRFTADLKLAKRETHEVRDEIETMETDLKLAKEETHQVRDEFKTMETDLNQAKQETHQVRDEFKTMERKLTLWKVNHKELRSELKVKTKQYKALQESVKNMKRAHEEEMERQVEQLETWMTSELERRKLSSRVRKLLTSCIRSNRVGAACCN